MSRTTGRARGPPCYNSGRSSSSRMALPCASACSISRSERPAMIVPAVASSRSRRRMIVPPVPVASWNGIMAIASSVARLASSRTSPNTVNECPHSSWSASAIKLSQAALAAQCSCSADGASSTMATLASITHRGVWTVCAHKSALSCILATNPRRTIGTPSAGVAANPDNRPWISAYGPQRMLPHEVGVPSGTASFR
jgi:hypothetical protein